MVGQSPTKSSPNNAIMTGNSRQYDVYYRRYADRSGRSQDPGTVARERAHVHGAAGTPAGVSRTTVHSRIERLLARRVITGFTIRMGADQERDQIQARS